MSRRSYPAELKAKVVREILQEEHALSLLLSSSGTPPTVLAQWRDHAIAALPGVFAEPPVREPLATGGVWEKEQEELYEGIKALTIQLNWLTHKCEELFGSSSLSAPECLEKP